MQLTRFCAAAFLGSTLLAPWMDAAMGQSSIEQRKTQDQAIEASVEIWIEMLGSPRYRDRVEATAKLQRSGVTALEAIKQAVLDGQVETSDRALNILRRHYLGEDAVLRTAAEKILREIAELDSPKSHAASKVLESTEHSELSEARPMLPPFPLIPPAPMFGNRAAGNQIFGAIGGGKQQIKIQVKLINGDKEVTLEENGKKIRVAKKSDGIEVEKTDEKGNKKKTLYKDLEELKKQDPEAHKAFQRGGAGIEIRIGGGGGQRPQAGLPEEIRKRRQEMLDRRDEILKRHEELRKQHFERIEKLKRATPRDAAPRDATPPRRDLREEEGNEKPEKASDQLPPAPPRGGLKV